MATSRVVLLLLLLHSGAALEIRGPSTHQATVGSAALIPCHYTVQKPPVDPKFFAAFWHFQGKEILSYDDEVRTTDARYSLNLEKALNGEVDLSISEIFLSDAGVYTCTVIYSPERGQKDITLHITVQTARPQIVITEYNVTIDKKSVLRCSVTGFHPMDIDIEWFRGTERMTDVTIDKPWRNSDGTYNVNSTVVIIPADEEKERIFSCRVRHESLPEPLQEDFQLTYGDKNVMSPNYILLISIVAVLGILIPIIAVIVVCCIRKKIRTPHPQSGAVPLTSPNISTTGSDKSTGSPPVTGTPHPQSGAVPLTSPNRFTTGSDRSTGSPPVTGTPHPQSGAVPLTSPNRFTTGSDRSTGSPPVTGTRPDLQIGEITVPELILNKRATMECALHNYDNGKHDITWYEKKPETEEPIPANDQRRFQTIGLQEESDHGLTCKAYLHLTSVKSSDDGAEYICRVTPSRSGEMIERRTGKLSVTEQRPSHNDKSPEKVPSPKLPEDQAEAYDQRQTTHNETVEERHIQEPRWEDREGLCPVNGSIHEEEKQKMPAPDHNVEKESDELGEYDNSEGTRTNGNIRAVCPANEAPGEERTEGHSLPTNELSHGKKTDDLEECSTGEDEEELDQKKEKEETSHLLNKPIDEEELSSLSEEEDNEETSLMNTKLDTGLDKSSY
ncbi:uncharacterized protein LOC122945117 [Bufo gargarizans]|uniref:uncharacterized protein LOC122945117 n=1 Tax=Bufo gargarizans TaxID=30331 RepID=UPI001CF37A86|nr:uncharacterized protein LOC122945117 [Bufo gargarizans]